MWGNFWPAFVVTIIGGTILSILEVDGQSTVDDSASCESSTLYDETVNLIREEFKNVKHLLASNRQHDNESRTHISKQDLEDLKASIQQQCSPSSPQQSCPTEPSCSSQDPVSSLSCEYRTLVVRFLRGVAWTELNHDCDCGQDWTMPSGSPRLSLTTGARSFKRVWFGIS